MDESLILYWKLFFENFSTDEIIEGNCLLKNYKSDLIDGPIIDIGCGQSKELLSFINWGKKIFAVDNEQFQLDYLKQRVLEKDKSKVNDWNFLNLEIGINEIPQQKYSLIICSNLLHFFTIEECVIIVNSWLGNTTSGTLIYIEVHSEKHPGNNPENPDNNAFFKHFFAKEDLEKIFPSKEFETIYFADTQKKQTAKEFALMNLWLDKWFEINSITDKRIIQEEKEEFFKNNRQANFDVIFKKK